MLTPLVLAIVISFDSFGVGLAYGLKGVEFPRYAYYIIAVCTTMLMAVSMITGTFLLQYLEPENAVKIGALILIFIGLWEIFEGFKDYLNNKTDIKLEPLINFKISSLGVIIQILKDPTIADMDNSRDISKKEAYTLGFALGMDAFAAGFSASMLGYTYYIMLPPVALFCSSFVALGFYFGCKTVNEWWQKRGFILPGMILIFIGILRLLFT
ncbi:MAG: sporulation membrane protein YtaF [Halanaerobiales bacterium]